ncbi:hypothetical protein [Terrarubrum flagellatum]|uniref:hypothetical protein n=1 Tax=Terrirubrum flagellatum TaxID=2895980 RepID=UPI00314517D1
MRIWKASGDHLVEMPIASLDREERLQNWLAADLGILGLDALLIGREVPTDFGGFIDILALDRDGKIIIIETKRHRTPREVVAQVLDYASWVKGLDTHDIFDIYARKAARDLSSDYRQRFEQPIPERLNDEHEIYIVAGSLDPSSRRIVEYLSEVGGIAINTAFFNYFRVGDAEMIAADWLLDQEQVVERAQRRARAPWTGYWFVNVGPDPNSDWKDNVNFGYVDAGGGAFYSKRLFNLKQGDRFYAYRKAIDGTRGYVGFGEVTGGASLPTEAELDGKPFLDLPIRNSLFQKDKDNAELANYVVPVKWLKTVSESDAKRFPKAFANQNIVCRLTDPATLAFLDAEFGS